jgi:hypothetical protein
MTEISLLQQSEDWLQDGIQTGQQTTALMRCFATLD